MRAIIRGIIGAALAAIVAAPAEAAERGELLAKLADGGRVMLMRHAQTTPGIGDPEGFTLRNCATQRNLSEEGRGDMRSLKIDLEAAGVRIAAVKSSPWCRCIDTGKLLAPPGVTVETSEALASLWDDQTAESERTAAVRAMVTSWQGPGTLLLVSHGVNVSPLIGTSLLQGGFAVLTPSGEGFTLEGVAGP